MITTALRIDPLPGCGAQVKDVDLARLTPAEAATLRQALFDHGVLIFRGQSLTPEQHIALAESLAPIDVNRFFPAAPGYPMIAKVEKTAEQTTNIGGGWHTDHSYDREPALGSVLYAREVPDHGGDTLFSSMSAAYDALSDGMKHTLSGMRAVHSSRHVFGVGKKDDDPRYKNAEQATQDAIHPVIVRHPDSGKKVLYVNPGFTLHFEGWTADESKPLLEQLYRHAARPEFGCRFQWRQGSLAFWDNRATWHYAVNDYHGARRLMHRITIEGVGLAG